MSGLTVEDRMLAGMAVEFLRDQMAQDLRRGRVAPGDVVRHRKAMADLDDVKRRLGVVSGVV